MRAAFNFISINTVIVSLSLILAPYCFSDEAAVGVSADRTIKEGDLLEIKVTGHDDLHRKVTVDNAGDIEYPLVKKVGAAGRTLTEFSIEFEQRLAEYVRYPHVEISFKNTFFIYGEVCKPGEYELEGRINVLKAITIGGGFTDFSSHSVNIIRSSSGTKSIRVNVDSIISGKKGRDALTLIEPGDVIVIPQSFF